MLTMRFSGIGLTAKSAEAGGISLIIIYNRYMDSLVIYAAYCILKEFPQWSLPYGWTRISRRSDALLKRQRCRGRNGV
jgi:hypothetical protein